MSVILASFVDKRVKNQAECLAN